jgi:hypothetical protein
VIHAASVAVVAAAVFASVAQAETITFSVTSVSISMKPTDLRPKGTSKGDTIVYRNRLLNTARRFGRPKGAVVGSDHGTLTFTSAHTARYAGTAVFPNGTVRLAGTVTPLANGVLQYRVAGGTGHYAKATGTVLVASGNARALNTYQLTLPGGGNIA